MLDCVLKKSKRKHPKISVRLLRRRRPVEEDDEGDCHDSEINQGSLSEEGSVQGRLNGGGAKKVEPTTVYGSGDEVHNTAGCEEVLEDGCAPVELTGKPCHENGIRQLVIGNEGCETARGGLVDNIVMGGSEGEGDGGAQEHVLLVKPGERIDNMFLQYSDMNKPVSSEQYDAPR